MTTYLFEIDQGNSERELRWPLNREPEVGQVIEIDRGAVVVTAFYPVTDEYQRQAAGHAGTVMCRLAA